MGAAAAERLAVASDVGRLTARQVAFAAFYIETQNATEAARRAGYAHPMQQGSRMLRNVEIRHAIESRQQHLQVQTDYTAALWLADLRARTDSAFSAGNHSAGMKGLELLGRHIGALTDTGRSSTVEDAFWQQLGRHAANAVAGQLSERAAGEPVTIEIDDAREEGGAG